MATAGTDAGTPCATRPSLTIAAPNGFLPVGDILPDFFSGTAMFNAGNFASVGYVATATQSVGDNVSATVVYGSTGALTANQGEPLDGNPDDLRALLFAAASNMEFVDLSQIVGAGDGDRLHHRHAEAA